jgi:hypothetical protein
LGIAHSDHANPVVCFGLPAAQKPGQVNKPIMGKTYTIRLESNDLGQLLDGLRCRSEAWHGTAEYLESGHTPREDFVIEECSDAEEARAIAANHDQIITSIEMQMRAQGPA